MLAALQISAEHDVATPANWRKGDGVIIPIGVTETEAKQRYPGGFRTVTPYLRYVADPSEG